MTEWKARRRLAKGDDHCGSPQWYSRGYIPHFEEENLTQTLTFRLFDSMPQAVLDLWREELRLLPEREANREPRERIDAYLDRGYGSCYLRDDRLARLQQDYVHALKTGNGLVHSLLSQVVQAVPDMELSKSLVVLGLGSQQAGMPALR